ncbi:MAG: FAD:protein FMN transferase [Bacteroidales bacterium]|nr:FAD:protein FMN transferase [Bacteroidales bacterium]
MDKVISKILLLLLLVISIYSCNSGTSELKKVHFMGEAQGTYYAITYYDTLGRNFQPQIDSLLDDFDQTVSLWEENSLLRQINSNQTLALNPLMVDMLDKSFKISVLTDGYFDISVGKLVKAWGFSFTDPTVLDSSMVDSLMQYVGYSKVKVDDGILKKELPEIELDFNAIAQGYSSDMMANFLSSKGIDNYLVDIGGEVIAKGCKPNGDHWVVGIEKPAEDKYSTQKVDVKIILDNMSVVTSGNYRKYYENNGVKYSHTINPFTGFPVSHTLLSVSVLSDKAWKADAMATAFMVMGLEKSLEFLKNNSEYDAYFIYNDNGEYKTYATEGFKNIIVK